MIAVHRVEMNMDFLEVRVRYVEFHLLTLMTLNKT